MQQPVKHLSPGWAIHFVLLSATAHARFEPCALGASISPDITRGFGQAFTHDGRQDYADLPGTFSVRDVYSIQSLAAPSSNGGAFLL